MRKSVLQALDGMIEKGTSRHRLARAMKREMHWKCSIRSAEARISRWLDPDCRERFPAEALPLVIEITGRDELTPILLRAAIRAEERKPAKSRRYDDTDESRRA